jgi:multiple antibiotic resistance protein
MSWLETFLLAFIPLFVAVDVFGVLPLFVGITEGMDEHSRRRLTGEATGTAFVISVVFLVAGKLLFAFLGITESDFRVGGGVVLLVLAVNDLLFSSEEKRTPGSMPGVVPIGIPLIMGPAALTTIIFLVHTYGYVWAVASLLVNMVLVWVVFSLSKRVTAVIGKAGSRAIAKVAALFLAGIAVMMIRSGVQTMMRGGN